MKLKIRKIKRYDDVPYPILYLADPSKESVENYLKRGEVYLSLIGNEIIGAYILLATRPFIIELVNIAIDERYQNKGYGKKMIRHAIEIAKKHDYKTMEVGIGNSGIFQLAFYQKCGFRITHVDFDFFKKNYIEPIFENGIECRDMIRLSMDI